MTMRSTLSATLGALLLASLGGCGSDREQEGERTTVASVVRGPIADLGLVSVRGRAFPLGDEAFVLNGARDSVWVLARPADVEGIRPGEEVAVSGDVRRLRPDQAVKLANLVESAQPLEDSADWRILRARRNGGVAYIDARGIERGDELDSTG